MGSAGLDARADSVTQCRDNDPAEIAECKRVGTEEGVCSSLVNCSCDKCACLLKQCQALPGCLALRKCALGKGCCSPTLYACQAQGCCNGTDCALACSAEVSTATAETFDESNSFQLALALDICVYGANDAGASCTPCPLPDAGDAAGGG
jgi:hypothetical protein